MDNGNSSNCSGGVLDFVSENSNIYICSGESTIVYGVSEIPKQTNSFIKHTKPVLESTTLDHEEAVEVHSVPEISVISESDDFITHDWSGSMYDLTENKGSELDDTISFMNETENDLDLTVVCSTPVPRKCSSLVTFTAVDAEESKNGDFDSGECTVVGKSTDASLTGESNTEHTHVLDSTDASLVFKKEYGTKHTRKLHDLNCKAKHGQLLKGFNSSIDDNLPLAKRVKVDNGTADVINTSEVAIKISEQLGDKICSSSMAPCEDDRVVAPIANSAKVDRHENSLVTSTKEDIENNFHEESESGAFVSTPDSLKISGRKDDNFVLDGFTNNSECNYDISPGHEIDLSHVGVPQQEREVADSTKNVCFKSEELLEEECDSESDVIVECIVEKNINKGDSDNTCRENGVNKPCVVAYSVITKSAQLSDKESERSNRDELARVNSLQVENEVFDIDGVSGQFNGVPVDKNCTSAGFVSIVSVLGDELIVVDEADITATQEDCGLKSANSSFCKSDVALPDAGISNVGSFSMDPITVESDSDVEVIAEMTRTPNAVNKKGCSSTPKEEAVKQGESSSLAPCKLSFGGDALTEPNGTEVINEVKTKPSDPQPFRSDDPQENIDNEDPEWDYMRKLQTDEARYKAVRTLWQAQVIPNPSRDLTYHSFRKKRLESEGFISSTEQGTMRGLKRPATEQLVQNETKRARTNTVSCTTPMDEKIKLLDDEYTKKVASVNHAFRNKKTQLETDYRKARELVAKNLRNKFAQNGIISKVCHLYGDGNLMVHLSYAEKCDKTEINRALAYRLTSLQAENDAHIRKLKKVQDEISKFCTYYKGLENNEKEDPTQLSEMQMTALNKIDKMYDFYNVFYRD